MFSTVLSSLGKLVADFVGPADETEPFQPTLDDMAAARDALSTLVPPELALIILDFAEYWTLLPQGACDKFQSLSASVAPSHDATNFYLVSDPIPPHSESVRARGVRFSVTSKDQGWCSEEALRGTYRGYTWHEVAILRPFADARPDFLSWLANNAPIEMESATVAGYSKQFEVPCGILDEPAKSRWLLQKNLTAPRVRGFYEHTITWKAAQDVTEQDIDVRQGSGDGQGFVELLQPGDRIAVLVRAKYPGWVNHVEKAEISVYYALA
ncbi:hypothetical protein HMN09_01270700 [Mycena chlorophos]|uniref:Uncharacterized protein n=1 Tax=Mycena chlorophos TaxID=658473 RepID=A0A8H6S308_MYCCL|nr:hypothetical protein HMN09_01270700 [Mycena chlorophos]